MVELKTSITKGKFERTWVPPDWGFEREENWIRADSVVPDTAQNTHISYCLSLTSSSISDSSFLLIHMWAARGDDRSSTWIAPTHVGDLDYVLGSWLQPGPGPLVLGLWVGNLQMKYLCVSTSVFMPFKEREWAGDTIQWRSSEGTDWEESGGVVPASFGSSQEINVNITSFPKDTRENKHKSDRNNWSMDWKEKKRKNKKVRKIYSGAERRNTK